MQPKQGDTLHVGTVPLDEARPIRAVVDAEGRAWLCDSDVDESKDLKEQGCLRCGDLPFMRDG